MIVPGEVLEELAANTDLDKVTRDQMQSAVEFEKVWRELRNNNEKAALHARAAFGGATAAPYPPNIRVFDCLNGTTLPGAPVSNPEASSDASAKRTAVETKAVAEFYKTAFGRNSLDDLGMTLVSSVHYGVEYPNAFWNGTQMTYGDGDGRVFLDFTKSKDVIAHELTHGLTAFTSGFRYTGQSGGLNESMSDVFGSMFLQWRLNQSVSAASWLIGEDIMGPGSADRGFKGLRDMSDPKAAHSLSKQPKHLNEYNNGMGPHTASGIPNHAFYHAAMKAGGNSWETVGPAWYKALTGHGRTPGIGFRTFANRTRQAASSARMRDAIDYGWAQVGI
jgi:Zn-dependent metalloprotease